MFACLAVAGVHAQADEVMLKNGDRITGRVLRKADGILSVDTGYAGKLEIKWDEVSGLTTDEPVKVILPDDSGVDAKESRENKLTVIFSGGDRSRNSNRR